MPDWTNMKPEEKRSQIVKWQGAKFPEIKNLQMDHVQQPAIISAMLSAAANDPKLWNCPQESWFKAYLNLCQIQLLPNTPLDHAYLIPFKSEMQVIVGYIGFIELAYRSKGVKKVWAELVYEADEFREIKGSSPEIKHDPGPPQDRTNPDNIIAAYAIAKLTNDELIWTVMYRDELDKIKAASKAVNSPAWRNWPTEMMKKAPIRRLRKLLPSFAPLALAATLDDKASVGESQMAVNAEYQVEEEQTATDKLTESLNEKDGEQGGEVKSSDDLLAELYDLLSQHEKILPDEMIAEYSPNRMKDAEVADIFKAISEVKKFANQGQLQI